MDSLVTLTQASRMLAEAKDLYDIAKIRDIAVAAKAYAKAAQLGIEATNNAAEIKIRAERKAGEYLKVLERGKGNRFTVEDSNMESSSEYATTLTDVGIAKTTAHRWQKSAEVPQEIFEAHIQETKQAGDELTSAGILKIASKKPHVSNNSGNNEWYTPKEYIEAARDVMGSIDVDPASSPAANVIVRAGFYYTEETNGLESEWFGNVWMNPPYAASLIGSFCEKLVSELDNIDSAIVLVNNATETKWFQLLATRASVICFPSSRVKFWNEDGDTGQPLQGQALLYIGSNTRSFRERFAQFGFICIL